LTDANGQLGSKEAGLRLDKWLWFARLFKTRSLATKFCLSTRLRINALPISKAHHPLKVGDILTFPLGPHVRVIKVLALGKRRGPATEARTLYEDLNPPQPRAKGPGDTTTLARRESGSGRPTKAERRATDRLRNTE
jgi:ribosome-associated heat shock protein Hsp15